MTIEDEIDYRGEPPRAHGRNPTLRRYLEVVQDVIVSGLARWLEQRGQARLPNLELLAQCR